MTTTNWITSIAAICIVFLIYYLLGSLVSWDFNISQWNIFVRLLVAILMFISFGKFIYSVNKAYNKK